MRYIVKRDHFNIYHPNGIEEVNVGKILDVERFESLENKQFAILKDGSWCVSKYRDMINIEKVQRKKEN